jgi:hypothetical protein
MLEEKVAEVCVAARGKQAQIIEVICGPDLAKQIANHLQKKYYDNYAMVTFSSDVEVLRPNKFSD